MESLMSVRSVLLFVFITNFVFPSVQTNNHEASISSTGDDMQSSYFFYQQSEYPKDCRDAQQKCSTSNSSGVYVIKPEGFESPFEVYCNNDVGSGGWTVIQRRLDDSVKFNRNWAHYKDGFGFLSTEFWLGNDKLSYLTNQGKYELRMDMTLSNGSSFYSIYKGFQITDEWSQYKIVKTGPFDSNGGTLISSCPTNMVYKNCSCQATCEDPKGEDGCHSDCSETANCVCPTGFMMRGNDCVLPSECGCFVSEENLVVPNGEYYVNNGCSQKCTCTNNQFNCEDYICGSNAVCKIKNGARQCYCNEGYEGDGQTCEALYTDCQDAYEAGQRQHGLYTIMPSGWQGPPFNVTCKMDNGGGWTVFQRRTDGVTSFYRDWATYKEGFGNHNGDFWLGNEKLYYLTNQRDYKLRVDIITSGGSAKNTEYPSFEIGPESNNYRLIDIGSNTGNAGYGLYTNYNLNKDFSTYDRDNDACGNFNCAEKHRSGWWHSNTWCSACYSSHCSRFLKSGSCHTVCSVGSLNGDYNGGSGQNIFWNDYRYCNLKFAEMKLLPST